jgi:hypothetical protein
MKANRVASLICIPTALSGAILKDPGFAGGSLFKYVWSQYFNIF